CVMEFKGSWEFHLPLVEFAYNNSYHSTIKMPPYEALYGRRCRSPLFWDDVEKLTVGPDLVQDVVDKVRIIQARVKEAQDRQKSWADQKRRVLEFEVGDHVYLKVNPIKSIRRVRVQGKLSPRYIGPFEVLERVGELAYRITLPPNLSGVHNVFHVSVLRKHVPDPDRVVELEPLQLKENLTYEEHLVKILDRKVQKLRSKEIKYVKVLWRNHSREEATWEAEDEMRSKYPSLFEDSGTYVKFWGQNFL